MNRSSFKGISPRFSASAISLMAVIMVMITVSPMSAATKTWNKLNGGAWNTAGNWTPSGAPAANDDVIIPSNQSANITAVPTISLRSLTINGTCALLAATSGNTLTVTGTLSVANGVTFTLGASGARLNFTLANTATGTLNGNAVLNFDAGTTARNFTVNGTLSIAANAVLTDLVASTGSNFILNSGATLQIGSSAGISTSGATGNIQVTGTRTYNTGANYVYNGSAAQATGNGLSQNTPASVTIDNAAGVTLGQDVTINGSLTLTSGVLSTGANKVIMSNSSAGAVSVTSGSINGEIQRSIATGSMGDYIFTDLNTRLTPNGSQGAITVSVRSYPNTTPPNIGGGVSINRYYTITPSGPLTATVRLAYLDSEINGVPEATMSLFRYTGVAWAPAAVSIPSPANNYVESPGISTFSDWTIGDADHPLPIQLASFTGIAQTSGDILLTWTTVSEVNNFGFFVERKRPAEQEYTSIEGGFVPGNGTTNIPQTYTFTDVQPGAGTWMYRLRQMDLDGSSTYSEPVTVNVTTSVHESLEPVTFGLDQNYPNPFNPSTNIAYRVAAHGKVKLQVYDMLGHEIATLVDEIKEPGSYVTSWNAGLMSSGMYFYRIETPTNTAVKRMTLLK